MLSLLSFDADESGGVWTAGPPLTQIVRRELLCPKVLMPHALSRGEVSTMFPNKVIIAPWLADASYYCTCSHDDLCHFG
jgi:hypothetical protein